MVNEIPLSEFGLETVAEVVARKGWAAKTVQNWINGGLVPAVVIGAGRSARFLLRAADVDAFTLPPRGPRPGNARGGRPPGKKNAKSGVRDAKKKSRNP